jgi:catechol 2,3-dioxygenase-like lactoylglutathione lyase family enzyme
MRIEIRRTASTPVVVATALLLLALAAPRPAAAQLATANAAGVSMGHLHYRVRDVPAHVRFWTQLGGRAIEIDKTQVVAFPDVFVFLVPGESRGGTEGSVVNHVAFRVPSFAAVEAAGLTVSRLKQFPGVGSVNTPEGERIELFENAATNLTFVRDAADRSVAADVAIADRHNHPLTRPIAFHHIHLNVPEGQVADAQAWYARMFGGVAGKRSNYDAVDLPGINFNISATPRETAPTEGRMLDHIGLEVKGLEAFARSLQAKGVALLVPYTRPPGGAPYVLIADPWGTSIELTEGLRAYAP